MNPPIQLRQHRPPVMSPPYLNRNLIRLQLRPIPSTTRTILAVV